MKDEKLNGERDVAKQENQARTDALPPLPTLPKGVPRLKEVQEGYDPKNPPFPRLRRAAKRTEQQNP